VPSFAKRIGKKREKTGREALTGQDYDRKQRKKRNLFRRERKPARPLEKKQHHYNSTWGVRSLLRLCLGFSRLRRRDRGTPVREGKKTVRGRPHKIRRWRFPQSQKAKTRENRQKNSVERGTREREVHPPRKKSSQLFAPKGVRNEEPQFKRERFQPRILSVKGRLRPAWQGGGKNYGDP